MTKTILIEGMMCAHCTAHVEEALRALAGVTDVSVQLDEKQALVTASREIPDAELTEAVSKAGYQVTAVR